MGARWSAVLVAGALLCGACTSVVPGTGSAADPPITVPPDPPPAADPSTPAGPRSGLAADVLADECLLDALALSELVGAPVLPPEQEEVERRDGSTSSACVADAARGFPEPLAAINVYEPRSGTPADFVATGPLQGRRELRGVGEAAAVIETVSGSTLQLAGVQYVVTIAVLSGAPDAGARDDDEWRAAAEVALAALPS